MPVEQFPWSPDNLLESIFFWEIGEAFHAGSDTKKPIKKEILNSKNGCNPRKGATVRWRIVGPFQIFNFCPKYLHI